MVDPHWGPVEQHPSGSSARPKKPSHRRTPAQRRLRLALKGLGLSLALLLVAGVAVVFIGYTTTRRPDPNADFQTATTAVYYNDAKARMGSFAVQNRTPLTFERMPDTMKEAIVAAENRTFWTDPGISIRGMIRAAWTIVRGEDLQGGSTITQQYIKILYLKSERTLTRKFREIFLAYKINRETSKEEILEGYLNTIYFGHGAYGLQAAARAYFDVDADKLTVSQAAFLSTVVNNPTAYDPDDEDNRERILERYRYVIQSMFEMGNLTEAETLKLREKLPKFPERETSNRLGGPKGFLLKMVERELAKVGFESSEINGGGLKVITTFDRDAQDAAVAAAQRYTRESAENADKKTSSLHAAVASVDVGSGEILALYGGPDYVKNSRNWATTPRPTASTFKTYALAAGLEDGYSLYSRFDGNTFTPPGDRTPVRNEFRNQYGSAVSLLEGTAKSINTVFVDLVTEMDDGAEKTMKMAEAVGAPKGAGWDDNSRLPLGTAEVSPLDQASAYATFANDGVRVPEHVVKEVRGPDGKVLYKAESDKKLVEKRAVSEEIAADVNFALSSVVDGGTGRAASNLNRPVAGKTGTKDREDDIVSAWFVGYTKQVSTAVMFVAGAEGTGDLDPYARPGDSTFFGGTYPALTWADYMAVVTEGQPVEDFGGPAYVNRDKYSEPTLRPEPTPTREATAEPSETEEPEPDPTTSSPEPEPSDTETETETEEPSPEPSATPGPTTTRPTPGPSNGRRGNTPNPGPSNSTGNGNGNGNGQGPGEE